MTMNQLPSLSVLTDDTIFPASKNSADYSIALSALKEFLSPLILGPILKYSDITATTTSSGNVTTNISYDDYVVISAVRTDAASICIPLKSASAGNPWVIHVTTTGASPSAVASTSVTLRLFLIPISAFGALDS